MLFSRKPNFWKKERGRKTFITIQYPMSYEKLQMS